MQNFGGQTKCIMGNVGMANRQKQTKGTKSRSLPWFSSRFRLLFRSLHCTGSVKPADDVHMVSGCTVAPMAYFYIVVFSYVQITQLDIVQLHIPSISLKYTSQFLHYYTM